MLKKYWELVGMVNLHKQMSNFEKIDQPYWAQARAISIKGLCAKMAKLSYIRQINRGNELLLLKESKVRLKVILSG